MIYEQVIGQKVTRRFHVDYDETEYLLDDGSKMRVALCKPCKGNLTEVKNKEIMDCVIEGWREEVKTLPWSDEKKKDYMDRYSKKEIICMAEGVPKDILQKKLKKYKEDKDARA
jgi:hypothetical protein